MGPIWQSIWNRLGFHKPWGEFVFCYVLRTYHLDVFDNDEMNFYNSISPSFAAIWSFLVLGGCLLSGAVFQINLGTMFNYSCVVVQNEFEEGGKLHGKRVYLFGCTERKFLTSFANIVFSGLSVWFLYIVKWCRFWAVELFLVEVLMFLLDYCRVHSCASMLKN